MITAEDVKKIKLFSPVPETELNSIAARAADVRLLTGEWLLYEGQTASFFGLLEGKVEILKSPGGHEIRVGTYSPSDYFGEVPLLLDSPAIASIRAIEPSRLMRLERQDFRELVTHCRTLNAEISNTMMDRVNRIRQTTVDTPLEMARVIGHRLDAECYRLREFLSRNRIPFSWTEPNGEPSNDSTANPAPPVVVLADGKRLEAPSFPVLAEALGLQTAPKLESYDVVIVGGGTAGLAAAVYGASEGLCTLLVEGLAFGGQAGMSSRIENYLGFPGGLSGEELSTRAYRQALRLGAELVLAREVTKIEPGDPASGAEPHVILLDQETRVRTRAIILATGVQWRRLEFPGMERLVGRGVYYGAARTEAMRFNGKTVHLVGGGNSAGQAAMYFSSYAKSVTMLVRGPSLAESMSQYLIDQLATKSNVTIETEVEVVGVEGTDALEAIEVECGSSRRRERRPSDGLFVFIGAEAKTGWLPDGVIRDQWAFICTGRDVLDLIQKEKSTAWPLERDPYLLETSIPGILAAGDVRHGSIKRCAAAVGEGSMAISVVHHYLAEATAPDSAATSAGRRG
jgi:thioredoxin reductase (NADPH)